jgi:hemerythrin superfamily protein
VTSLTSSLIAHHKLCDGLYADAEAAAHGGHWQECADALQLFRKEIEAHFATEEQVLFPVFEKATGVTAGPTLVMRTEHDQMRRLIGDMATAQANHALGQFAGAGETLLIFMQQHNMKEENILYPMCDLSDDSAVECRQQPARAAGGGVRCVIDGRDLLPPEPLELTLAALDVLPAGGELLLQLFCRPHPLFQILRRNGYVWQESVLGDGTHEIHIRKA